MNTSKAGGEGRIVNWDPALHKSFEATVCEEGFMSQTEERRLSLWDACPIFDVPK